MNRENNGEARPAAELGAEIGIVTRSRSGRAPRLHKKRLRSLLYIGLILCDCAAMRAGFSLGLSMRPWQWLAPNGVELGLLILPLHVLLSLRNGAISRGALERRSESVFRALSAFMAATSLIALLIFFQYAGPLVSRLAFGVAIVSSLVFIALLRIVFSICFITPLRGGMTGELLIVDGVEPRSGAYHYFDACAAGFVPNLDDPAALSRMAQLLRPYDRVVVACTEERRYPWALLLKAYNVIGEIQLDQGSPLGAIAISHYHGNDTIVVSRGSMSLGSRLKKRAFDLAVATGLLIAAAPLLAIVAIAIKLESRGPVLFSQIRLGRDNRRFRILKLRSMYAQTSDFAGDRSATRDDDRITRVGRIIRKTSIDELPQLLNVLKGDMSIVGPRPHALGSLAGDKLFWQVTQKYWLRHRLKPGITGLAQVRGFRGATHQQSDLENRLQSDLEYVDGWRMWRDIAIIFNTVKVLVHPRAY